MTHSSEFLKDCMADAVMRLLEKYSLNEIQIKQICAISGYHRASWFRAFRSKSEAITYYMVPLWQKYCDKHDIVVSDDWSIDNAGFFSKKNILCENFAH